MTFQELLPALMDGKTIERPRKNPTRYHGNMPRYIKFNCNFAYTFADTEDVWLESYEELAWDWLSWSVAELTLEDFVSTEWALSTIEPEMRKDLYSK